MRIFQRLARKRRPRRPRVSTAVFDLNHADKTCGIQTAIDIGSESEMKEVYVPNAGQSWIIQSPDDPNKNDARLAIPAIRLRSNLRLILLPGAVIEAKRNHPQFEGKYTSLMGGDQLQNVTIIGYGATLKMWRADYAGPFTFNGNTTNVLGYTQSEWRHSLIFRGGHNIWVEGLTAQSTGGDCISLEPYDPEGSNTPCSQITLKNNIFKEARRNVISITSCSGLQAEDCTFMDGTGTAPQSACDIEPEDFGGEIISGIYFKRCTFSTGPSRALLVNWDSATVMTSPAGVVFEDCAFNSSGRGIHFVHTISGAGPTSGTVKFLNCTITTTNWAAVLATLHRSTNIVYSFKGLTINKPATLNQALSPFTLAAPVEFNLTGSDSATTTPHVTFEDVQVNEDTFDRKAVLTANVSGTSKFVSGAIRLRKSGTQNTAQAVAELPLLLVDYYTPAQEARVNTTGVVEPVLDPVYLDSHNRVIK